MDEIYSVFEELGLSRNEIRVYISLLSLKEESASKISQIAKLNRITTYSLLKSLKEKGFCSIFNKNKIQYFKVTEPEELIKLIEFKKEKIKEIIPKLKEKQNIIKTENEVSIFNGKDGILYIINVIINDSKKNKIVLSYGDFKIANKIIKYESQHWRKKRIINKIKNKTVVSKIIKISEFKNLKNYNELTEIRENSNLEKINSYTIISENYVAFLFPSENLECILIKNKFAADKERRIFENFWNSSKNLK